MVEDKLVIPVKLPPVICALPEAKFVKVPYTAPMLATALMYPPLITAFAELKLFTCNVVTLPLVEFKLVI